MVWCTIGIVALLLFVIIIFLLGFNVLKLFECPFQRNRHRPIDVARAESLNADAKAVDHDDHNTILDILANGGEGIELENSATIRTFGTKPLIKSAATRAAAGPKTAARPGVKPGAHSKPGAKPGGGKAGGGGKGGGGGGAKPAAPRMMKGGK